MPEGRESFVKHDMTVFRLGQLRVFVATHSSELNVFNSQNIQHWEKNRVRKMVIDNQVWSIDNGLYCLLLH